MAQNDTLSLKPNLKELERILLGISNTDKPVPLAERFRALFALKGLKSDQAVSIVAKGKTIIKLVARCLV